jgi:hypothetical protein
MIEPRLTVVRKSNVTLLNKYLRHPERYIFFQHTPVFY